MQQVAEWLKRLNLGQYSQRFAENDIDFSVLPHLTDADLEKIGVSLGHRRKILAAIAELAGAPPSKRENVGPIVEAKPHEVAERRQVTVMFSDLVGSTALSVRMDPEDLREVVSAYQKAVAETVQRFGGFVAKFLGDGVLVYFGYPQAHEDDAERAVRAGLELVGAVGALKTHAPLQTRVGIATGLVVVGELIGSGASQEHAIVGETPNLAARLQAVAEPNTVVIAESARKLLGNLFELENLGAKDLKGVIGSVQAWAALRPASVESRFEALHATSLTALVGREEEIELLMRRWARAKSGEGQVVLLSGEAGIGKSRLTATLLENLSSEPQTRVRYFCSPQHTDSAFHPIIGQLERAAAFARDDTPVLKLDKVDALLALASASKQDSALIAELLSIPNDGRYPTLDLTPQQRRQKTLDALNAQMEGLSRVRPLLMIFEDAHWADPTTLEVFGRCIDRIPNIRVLLLVTFRPEFQAPWVGRPHVTSLMINRLAEVEANAMIDRIVGNKPLPAKLRRDIIERTDGIPLFIEEMTNAVLEASGEAAAERTVAAIPSPIREVPSTLHASLMARLDRLGRAKEIAQIGSVIGREFSHDLLTAVVQSEATSAIDRLVDAGLLFRQGTPPDATYLFKHALVQDAAYSTLLREPRRALHARIADILESKFTEIADNQPELLARHYTEAGQIEKAASLWGKAGQRSVERSALVEAIEQFTRALAQIATLPGTPGLRRQQINFQVAIINPLMAVKGFAAPEITVAVEQARLFIEQSDALGEHTEDPLLLYLVLYGVWATASVAFNGDLSRNISAQVIALAEKQKAPVPLMIGHRLTGISLLYAGEVAESMAHLNRARALYDPVQHRLLAGRFGQDANVAILSYLGLAQWLLGYCESATATAGMTVRDSRETGQATAVMYALFHASLTHILCRNYTAASAEADELISLANEKSASLWTASGTAIQGSISALTGKASDAVRMITSGLAAQRSTGATLWLPLWLLHLACARAELAQYDDAWHCIADAMAAIQSTKERWVEAELNRIAGEVTLTSPQHDAAKAQVYFERALSVAREQQAKSWELRAAMSMARLWRSQGKPQQARELLAPVYGWFTEGFDTLDLQEAKALLDELAS